jgi:hypothetical protein
VKIIVLGGVIAAVAALMVVLYAGARARGLETHCRNNLRHLGDLAARNWGGIDPQRTGRVRGRERRQRHALVALGAGRVLRGRARDRTPAARVARSFRKGCVGLVGTAGRLLGFADGSASSGCAKTRVAQISSARIVLCSAFVKRW